MYYLACDLNLNNDTNLFMENITILYFIKEYNFHKKLKSIIGIWDSKMVQQ